MWNTRVDWTVMLSGNEAYECCKHFLFFFYQATKPFVLFHNPNNLKGCIGFRAIVFQTLQGSVWGIFGWWAPAKEKKTEFFAKNGNYDNS